MSYHASKVVELAAEMYEVHRLEPQMEDSWVIDSRDLRIFGPFSDKDSALKYSSDLNDYLNKYGTEGRPFVAHDAMGNVVKELSIV